MERNTNLKMEELAADFIRDPAGTWWLIQIKAFKLAESSAVPVLRHFLASEEAMYEVEHKETNVKVQK